VVADPRLLAWSAIWGVASLVAFGLVSAIIPNPVFGREIAPEPFAIATWVASAPLMGLVLATYTARPSMTETRPIGPKAIADEARDGSVLGTVGGIGAFLAIGCPVCNKLALLLLGTSGAMTVYAPIQPVIGIVSLGLLVATAVWRIRLRMRGDACAATIGP
jgi:hypothetical protein